MIHVSCLLVGGPVQDIYVYGRRYTFEWHPYCGPVVLRRDTLDPVVNQPDENSPFWNAVTWWDRQGRRMANGRCLWNKVIPDKHEETVLGRVVFLGKLIHGECCELQPGI